MTTSADRFAPPTKKTASARIAVLICTAELLRDGLGSLFDAGLRIAGSFDSRALPDMDSVVLRVEGDALPERCGAGLDPLREVSVEFTSESYGRQRLVRVSAITLTGRTIFDISPPRHAWASAA